MAWNYEIIYTNTIGQGFTRKFHNIIDVESFVNSLGQPATISKGKQVVGHVTDSPYNTVDWLDTAPRRRI